MDEYRMALIFHGSRFANCSLRTFCCKKFCNFVVKMPRPHNGRDLLHLKTPACAELSYHRLTTSSVHCILRLSFPLRCSQSSFQIPGHSPDLRRIELAVSAMADIVHDGTSPCGPGSLHFDYCPSSLLKYTNRAIKLAVARVRWNTLHVAIGAQHVSKVSISRMTCNS